MESSATEYYNCELCPKSFTKKKNLHQHERQVHGGEKPHKCGICSKTFSRKMNKELHVKTCTQNLCIGGEVQKKKYRTINDLKLVVIKKSSAFGGIIADWTIRYPHDYYLIDPFILLKKSAMTMKDVILEHNRTQTKRLKFNLSIHIVFEKASNPEIKTVPPVVLTTQHPYTVIHRMVDVDEFLEKAVEDLIYLIEEYQRNGSGWVIDHLVCMDINLNSF